MTGKCLRQVEHIRGHLADNLDTFKSCDMISYKDSPWDVSMCSKTIT